MAELFRNIARHGIGAAKHLEGVEAKAPGFVFDAKLPDAEMPGHAGQIDERCWLILREAGMEGTYLLHFFLLQQGKVFVSTCGHCVHDPLYFFRHRISPFVELIG